jgi:hypothetical protein
MIGSILLAAVLSAQAAPDAERWYKGNTHAHTLWDDGDALPQDVVAWYRSRGYQFLVLSDHNDRNAMKGGEGWITANGVRTRLIPFDELVKSSSEPGTFALLPGQEIGDAFQGKLVHHAVFNTGRILLPPGGESLRDVMSHALRDVAAEGQRLHRPVVAQLSHPNLGWTVSADDLAAVDERFVEIYSGHPVAQTFGDATHPSVEALWDRALTLRLRAEKGPMLYGVACDDAHHYSGRGQAHPGRGWVVVRAKELGGDAIAGAMLAGDFYSSTGIVLEKLIVDDCGMRIRVASESGAHYHIRFLGTRREGGEAGVLLQESEGPEAYYEFRGDELYVRGDVLSDRPHPDPTREGEMQQAWIQPVSVGPR